MKIALAQMKVIPGKAQENVANMLSMITEAKAKKANIIVFPEMCVGGYLLGDKWNSESYCEHLMSFNAVLKQASQGIAVAFGNVYLDKNIQERTGDKSLHPNKDGRTRKYNAIYVFQNGEEVKRSKKNKILPESIQPKTLLPNYRIFDDERYFFSNEDLARDFDVPLEEMYSPFELDIGGKKIKMGFELCEDLWCEDYRRDLAPLNPTKMLINNGAELIINLSASPWTYGKNNARDRRVFFLKKESGEKFVPFFYVNCVGSQNNGKNVVTFDGGSTVYNKEGKPIIFSKKSYEQELIIIDETNLKEKERIEASKIEQKYEAIINGIKSFKDMNGLKEDPRFVLGLSGGIDSSLVAALLVKALGKERVMAINMPTKYNSEKTKTAAAHVAKKLGIAYETIPIGEMVKINEEILNSSNLDNKNKKISELNAENVQAKIRGTAILSNVCGKYNAFFTNNGNKVEVALGYATLYGDVGGAIAPIADLTKIEVVELAKFMNKKIFGEEVIPEVLFPDELWRFKETQIQPSAELKDKQIDPMKFVYHCALIDAYTDFNKKNIEDIMQLYLEGKLHTLVDKYLFELLEKNIGLELMKRWGVDNPPEFIKDIEWLDTSIQKNVFKRVQAPPIIITSKSSYGFDIRESILPWEETAKQIELKKKILNLKGYIPYAS